MGLINTYKTAARRVFLPNHRSGDLIVDLGSGDTPAPRAHIACDFLSDDSERGYPLKVDRPFVWASLENLPFKNKAFDYSICSHVVEHLERPEKCLPEIERISKSGYIETPSAFFEYVIPYTCHVSRVTVIENVLNITFKQAWGETFPEEAGDVFSDALRAWNALHARDMGYLLTQYYWKDKLRFKVNNTLPESFVKETEMGTNVLAKRSKLKELMIKLSYFIFTPRSRVRLADVLCCPKCKSEKLELKDDEAVCVYCLTVYPKFRGHYDFRI